MKLTPSYLATVTVVLAFLFLPAYHAVADGLMLFNTEQAAQEHCPKDTVVWLNTKSGVYHLKGERWYGNTKSGAFVCKMEADQAGDRETENGQ
jgi:hypothetical protein